MWSDDLERHWQQLAAEVYTGMKEWRLAHPRATLTEIEAALDHRLATVRARMLQDVALTSAATDVVHAPPTERAGCPTCGHSLAARGREARTLTTSFDQPITLTRSRAVCPACGAGVFPPR
jgi:ribosomal protein S27AE